MMYNFWFSVGAVFAPVALQLMSTYAPDEFRVPIDTQVHDRAAPIDLPLTFMISGRRWG